MNSKITAQIPNLASNNTGFLSSIFGKSTTNVLESNTPLILFGAGNDGKFLLEILKIHNVNPTFFCDNKLESDNQLIFGLPSITFNTLKTEYKNAFILISSTGFFNEIHN